MNTDTARHRSTLSKLTNAFDELEDALEPLLSKPLAETATGLPGPLDRAKLNALVPYMVHDLLFIYLKTRGVDPKTHAVVGELERVKQSFAKIKQAEDPEKRRLVIDREAAGRFIKHAIAQAKAAERREQKDMEVDGTDETNRADDDQPGSSTGAKRRRPAFDPFAGYGDTASDAPVKRTKTDDAPAFKYNEKSPRKAKARAPSPEPVPEEEDDDESDDSVLDIIEGDPSALVVEDANPNTDGSWTVVQKAKARERKEKLGFGGGAGNKKRKTTGKKVR